MTEKVGTKTTRHLTVSQEANIFVNTFLEQESKKSPYFSFDRIAKLTFKCKHNSELAALKMTQKWVRKEAHDKVKEENTALSFAIDNVFKPEIENLKELLSESESQHMGSIKQGRELLDHRYAEIKELKGKVEAFELFKKNLKQKLYALLDEIRKDAIKSPNHELLRLTLGEWKLIWKQNCAAEKAVHKEKEKNE